MTQVRHVEGAWRETRDKWAKIWFEQMCRFHERKPQPIWEFTVDDLIIDASPLRGFVLEWRFGSTG